MKKNSLYIFISIVVLGILGFFALNNYIYQQKQADEKQVVEPFRGTLSGEYLCLPLVDMQEPILLECRYGIKTDSNEFYALDFLLYSQELPELEVGNRFTANGVITPIEYLSTDEWRKYNVTGIFSVTDSIQILDN